LAKHLFDPLFDEVTSQREFASTPRLLNDFMWFTVDRWHSGTRLAFHCFRGKLGDTAPLSTWLPILRYLISWALLMPTTCRKTPCCHSIPLLPGYALAQGKIDLTFLTSVQSPGNFTRPPFF
jgi:hypothetical protein